METNRKDWGVLEPGRAAVAASTGIELRDGPLHVVASEEVCSTRAGQITLLGFLNMACRSHRLITLEFSVSARLLVTPMHGDTAAKTLEEAAISMIRAVFPECSVWASSRPVPGAITIGFGPVDRTCTWNVAVQRAVATVSAARSSAHDWEHPGSEWGGALAACLAASAAFRTVHGRETPNARLSAWNWAEGKDAELGPDSPFPLAGGSKLMVGAGSVAGALAHWLHYLGAVGTWSIVDRDSASDENLIKGINLTAKDIGCSKAEQLAGFLPNARWEAEWYGDSTLAREQHAPT